jgi:RimK family alpha-L-glutamate ligase
MSAPRVVIFNDTHGWHSERLTEALEVFGLQVILSDLGQCRIDLSYPSGLFIPELGGDLPDAVIVRGIAPGSLEQITLRMDVLHTLAELGVIVFNPASAIEHTVDKARTSLRMHLAGLSSPATWACESINQARHIAQREFARGHSLVVKPLFGCQGKGIAKLDSMKDFERYQPVGDAFYLQQYVQPEQAGIWQDWRLFVIDNEVCAAMSRRSNQWITNFAQGAECFATAVTEDMAQLAISATQAVEADYAGVDLIRSIDGEYSVLEVNSVPAWKGLYQATQIDAAQHIAKAIYLRIQQHCSRTHVI